MEALTMYRELGFKMTEETNHVKTEMQTVVKMSCDPSNMAYSSSSESKSMKEDRFLDSFKRDSGREKGDLSKDDVCSLSSEWQLRTVDLYRKGVQIKTEESVLGTEDKSLDLSPLSMKCAEKSDDDKENASSENMKQPNLMENEKNKMDSNKNASRKNNSVVYMYKLEKEKFIEYCEKDRTQEVQVTSVKKNKLKENMKIRDRKQRQEEENMKMKQNLMSRIVDSENEHFDSKTAKNQINEKQKKDETNIALVAEKKLVMSDHSIDQQNQNFHDEQDVEKQEVIEKVDADPDLKLPVKKSAELHMIQTSIDETDTGQTYLPTLLRDLIVHISQDEKITQGQLVQKGLTDLGIKRRDVTERKQTQNETADIHCAEKQGTGRNKFITWLTTDSHFISRTFWGSTGNNGNITDVFATVKTWATAETSDRKWGIIL